MAGYSHSQVHTYLSCPLKYKFDKIDGFGKTTKESSLNLILGTAVHTALEYLYTHRINYKMPDLMQVVAMYEKTFQNECTETTTTFTPEEIEQFIHRGRAYIQRYRDTYYPFDQAIPMAVEQSFSIKLTETISFSGYIDRIDVVGDTLILIDYKTNKQLMPDDDDAHREQLTLYALGMSQKYGTKFSRIDCCLIYLHLQKEVRREATNDDLLRLQNTYLGYAEQIETAKALLAKDPTNTTIFPSIVSKVCDYCPFRMICPERTHATMDDESVATELGVSTIKTLIDEYGVLQKKISELEKEKKMLAEVLVQYATAHGLKKIYGNTRQTSVHAREFWSVPTEHEEQFWHYAKAHNLVELLYKPDTNALAKLIKERQIDLADISSLAVCKASTRLGVAGKKGESN